MTILYQSSQVYQVCTNSVPTVYQSSKTVKRQSNSKNDHWCTNRHMSTKTVPTVYQQCANRQKTVKTQSKQHKNDHWCTSRHMSTNTIPTVYQKQSKQQKMTFGVPIVTGLPRLYKQCNNCLPIVNKNLAIANRSRVSCAHNTSRAFIDLNITP